MLVSLKDKSKGEFGAPLMVASIDEAKRALVMAFLNGEKSMLTTFPQQFELYKVSDFDVSTGVMTPINPEFIMNGYTAKYEAIETIKNAQVDTITPSPSGNEDKVVNLPEFMEAKNE